MSFSQKKAMLARGFGSQGEFSSTLINLEPSAGFCPFTSGGLRHTIPHNGGQNSGCSLELENQLKGVSRGFISALLLPGPILKEEGEQQAALDVALPKVVSRRKPILQTAAVAQDYCYGRR